MANLELKHLRTDIIWIWKIKRKGDDDMANNVRGTVIQKITYS